MTSKRKTETDLRVEARLRANIRAQMHELGMSKIELARKAEVDSGHVTRLLQAERGAVRPGLLVRICEALGMTPSRALLHEPSDPRFYQPGSEET